MNTEIPRYTSSTQLQSVFITNADGCGDHIFTQEKRVGNVCLYRRNKTNGIFHSYEVFVTKTVKAGSKLPGGNFVKADYEVYPGAHSFGKTAWSHKTIGYAESKFDETVKSAIPLEDNVDISMDTPDIPEGEFTRVEFATMNCMSPDGSTIVILKNLLSEGKIKESRREQRGQGKPTVLYVKTH